MRRFACLVTIVLSVALVSGQRAAKTLDIYVVDVEGGNATLFVSPSGESLLIDAGNGGMGAARDAGRIVEAAKDASLTQINHLIVTHWHGDHYGGLAELASRIPIRHFIDHGANIQPTEATDAFLNTTYPALYAKGTHTSVKAGETIPFAGVTTRVVASAGQVVAKPLAGAGKPNPFCGTPKPVEPVPEDTQSVATLFTFGKFRALHPGDLTQMHFSLLSGQEYTPPGVFIANGVDDQPAAMPIAAMPLPAPGANAPPPPVHSGKAYWIKVSAREDGTFTVTNSRNGFSKDYR